MVLVKEDHLIKRCEEHNKWNATMLRNKPSKEQGDEGNHDRFPPFDPQSDISCGQFVALSIDRAELEAGVPFYIGKVIEDGKN